MKLAKYDAARHALMEATRVDEVKSIRDKAVAMAVYAQQAKDHTLIAKATEIRLRAERRAGKLLTEMKDKGERHEGKAAKGSRVATPTATPKLSDLGVSKTQSSRWQKLAALGDDEFEVKIDDATERAVASIDRAGKAKPAKPKTKAGPKRHAVNRCVMTVRRLIFETIQEIAPFEVAALLAEIRDEISDLETKAKANAGHHSARQSA